MISFNEAIEIIDNLDIKPTGFERIFILDAVDRILAEDIVAKENSPTHRTSSMDGYAIKQSDIDRELKVIDNIPAGSYKDIELKDGEAIKIFTGAIVPNKTDLVVPIEYIKREKDSVKIEQKFQSGFAIREIGEHYREAELLLKKGTKIGFAEIGVLSGLNIAEILVYKKPKVSIISTGDEVLSLCEKRTNPSQIRSSNNYMLFALAKKYGANPSNLGSIKDDKESLKEAISEAFENSDILVTTGGVSVGDFDFVKDIVKAEGEVVIDKVAMKPGRHIKVIKHKNRVILALPGFSYSATITFLMFGVRVINKYLNHNFKYKTIEAKLKKPLKKSKSLTDFRACNLIYENGEYFIDFENKKAGSSAILLNMIGENLALAQLNEGIESFSENKKIKAIILN